MDGEERAGWGHKFSEPIEILSSSVSNTNLA